MSWFSQDKRNGCRTFNEEFCRAINSVEREFKYISILKMNKNGHGMRTGFMG
jgi:hypothetical protein